jgi:hypothetical protein
MAWWAEMQEVEAGIRKAAVSRIIIDITKIDGRLPLFEIRFI